MVQGSTQGVWINIDGSRSVANNFVAFADANGIQGRIEGETISDLNSNPEYIYEVSSLAANVAIASAEEGIAIADIIAAAASTTPCVGLGVCETVPIPSLIAAATANLIVVSANLAIAVADAAAYVTFKNTQAGVTYQSGAGDYAEWLPKANPNDNVFPGDIVGVKGGRVSKNTQGAEKMMVISHKPIVLGNVPNPGEEKASAVVAFMGQVPTRVIGRVNLGDYILPGADNNGIELAAATVKSRGMNLSEAVFFNRLETESDFRAQYINATIQKINNAIVAQSQYDK